MTQIFESCPVYAIRPHCSAHMVSLLNKKSVVLKMYYFY